MHIDIFKKVFVHPDNKRMCRERVSSSTNRLDQSLPIAKSLPIAVPRWPITRNTRFVVPFSNKSSNR